MKSSAIGVCLESGSKLMRTFCVEAAELAQAISAAAQSRKSAPPSFLTFKESLVFGLALRPTNQLRPSRRIHSYIANDDARFSWTDQHTATRLLQKRLVGLPSVERVVSNRLGRRYTQLMPRHTFRFTTNTEWHCAAVSWLWIGLTMTAAAASWPGWRG